MAEIAFLEIFVLLSFPEDRNENRRHLHLFRVRKNESSYIAKIWIEKNGKKDVSIAEYANTKVAKQFSSSDEAKVLNAISDKW